ncbi:MAG: hypothetical protein HKO03_03270 [Acidimicrobiia bacterium]|nr:hypothetical protein [Acidimicrobiia bacterium]
MNSQSFRSRAALCALIGIVFLFVPLPAAAATGTIQITEFMASNSTTLFDEDGASSDWIELHNPGGSAVDITGWYLSDDETNPTRWQLPARTIQPGGYLIVFASSKNRTGSELHTNFGLSANGEYLGLREADGTTVSWEYSPSFPQQTPDISYGLDGVLNEVFFSNPTPGGPNSAGTDAIDPLAFSVERGFYDSTQSVAITTTTPNATIRYTVDGSEPTSSHGNVYSSPISISTTTPLRAHVYRNGWLSPPVASHTYLFVDEILNQPATISGYPNNTYSTGQGTATHDYEMDPAVVNDPAYSSMITDAMTAIPTMAISVDPGDMWGNGGFYDGEDVEKPMSVEVIYPDDPGASHQGNGGIESHSHDRLKRSLRLNFSSTYGMSNFDTDMFQTAPVNGETASDQVKRIILRGGNNRSWARTWNPDRTTYTEDEFYRSTQVALSGIGSHGTFVHLYINGIYWGLYNPVERPDEHFTSEYLGGDNADYFFRNHGGATDGDASRYNYLTNTLVNQNMANAGNYAELEDYLDIDAFIDYIITSFYIGLTDWPQNNWYHGNRNPSSPLGSAPGQYYAWDGEWSFDVANGFSPPDGAWVHPDFRSGASSSQPIGRLWHAARGSDEFMSRFADRVHQHLFNNGPLTDANALARFTALNNFIDQAIVGESARWGDALGGSPRTRNGEWLSEVGVLGGILNGNSAQLISALRAQGFYPAADPPIFNQFGGPISPGFDVSMNNPNGSGTIYYTLDGSDPRATGGGIATGASAYSGPVNLDQTTHVHARVRVGSEWSALTEAAFYVPSPLRITELHYHPADPTPSEIAAGFVDSDEFEFVEILNTDSVSVDLNGVRFMDGIDFTFGDVALAPNERVVAVSNQAAFDLRYGSSINVAGEYGGQFNNAGERVELIDELGFPIHAFTYDDVSPWPTAADGLGPSLDVIDVNGDYSSASNWQESTQSGGTPGSEFSDNTPPTVTITNPPNGSNQSGPDVTISGTAADTQTGVSRVKVMIQRQSDSTYWDGTTWVNDWSWVDATGTETWSYPLTTLDSTTYVAIGWSWDGANIICNLSEICFTLS